MDKADDLRPLLNNKKWISGLAQRHSLLTQKKEQFEGTLRDIEDHQESLRKGFENKSQSELDLKELKAAVVAARKAGDVEQRLAEVRKQVAEEATACKGELARLGRFTGTVDSLLNLALPATETLDKFEKENDEISEVSKKHPSKKTGNRRR